MATKFDVIIVGGGIGGLACGCYLAKKNFNVLILEKNSQVGGYCTSFHRRGFRFDSAIHAFGSLRAGGQVDRFLQDFDIDQAQLFVRHNPSDIIFTPDFRVRIYNEIAETIDEIGRVFPKEKDAISAFIQYIVNSTFYSFLRDLSGASFERLLDKYFRRPDIKELFKVLSGCLYVPSSNLSAITAAILFKEFIFDGGYYPIGGMQAFSDRIAQCFKALGGTIRLNSLASKIEIDGERVSGVKVDNDFISAKYVVSSCDVRRTFLEMIGPEYCTSKLTRKITTMVTSASPFMVYLGVKSAMCSTIEKSCTYWLSDTPNVDMVFEKAQRMTSYPETFLISSIPSFSDRTSAPGNCDSMCLICAAPFKTREFWDKQRDEFAGNIVRKFSHFFPGIPDSMVFKLTATPHTFFRYTYNTNGAFRGWAPSITQDQYSLIRSTTEIQGLFLAGHWVTQPGQGGVPMVINSGRVAAEAISRDRDA